MLEYCKIATIIYELLNTQVFKMNVLKNITTCHVACSAIKVHVPLLMMFKLYNTAICCANAVQIVHLHQIHKKSGTSAHLNKYQLSLIDPCDKIVL